MARGTHDGVIEQEQTIPKNHGGKRHFQETLDLD
jgi:hypothetical protein